MHVLERYTMIDTDTIRYEATITDPNVYTAVEVGDHRPA